jgi:sec-independent protein translocase protein TatA
MFRGGLEPWHVIVIVAVIVLLFGYKKLPSASKSIAQSLKIFKEETKGLRGGDHDDETPANLSEPTVVSQGTSTGGGAIPAPVTIAAPVTVPAAPVTVPAEPVAAQAQSLAPKPTHR